MSGIARRREYRARRFAAEQELFRLQGRLQCAYSTFNHTADPQLLEASILEISSLQSRYAHALRQLKALCVETV